MTLAAFLRDMFPPTPATRHPGQPSDWKGIWYADGNIPH
jgi:hypothetical protein